MSRRKIHNQKRMPKNSRNSRIEDTEMKGRNNTPHTREDKLQEMRDTSRLTPLNQRQAEYIDAIYSDPVVICTGVWGSSKTYIPSVIAADLLMAKQIEKIVIARPAEGKAKSVGFFKGDKNQKLSGWAAPILDVMRKRLGPKHLDYCLQEDVCKIELVALEQIKGRSWDNAFIIVDEAEDLEPETAKSLVGRQGVNSTIVITGDIDQKDLKSYSGLELLLEVADYGDINMSVIDFDDWDHCVRSEEAKAWGMAFESYERENGRV